MKFQIIYKKEKPLFTIISTQNIIQTPASCAPQCVNASQDYLYHQTTSLFLHLNFTSSPFYTVKLQMQNWDIMKPVNDCIEKQPHFTLASKAKLIHKKQHNCLRKLSITNLILSKFGYI